MDSFCDVEYRHIDQRVKMTFMLSKAITQRYTQSKQSTWQRETLGFSGANNKTRLVSVPPSSPLRYKDRVATLPTTNAPADTGYAVSITPTTVPFAVLD